MLRIARPNRRARIETTILVNGSDSSAVSPGLTAGRGLKRHHKRQKGRGTVWYRPA